MMSARGMRKLTKRQREVMDRIDRRVPIKVIARELNISETRINQHIRALKDIYMASSLNELVDLYRAERHTLEAAWEALGTVSAHDQPPHHGALVTLQPQFYHQFAWQADSPSDQDHALGDFEPAPRVSDVDLPFDVRERPGLEIAIPLRIAAILSISVGIMVLTILLSSASMMLLEGLDKAKLTHQDASQTHS